MKPQDGTLQLDKDERILYVVRRSLLGVFPQLFFAIAIFIGLLVSVYLIARFPDNIPGDMSSALAVTAVIGIATVIEIVIYLLLTTYFKNSLILTNESIVQRTQLTPFNSTISQLSLENIEDVTVRQSGFFSTIFNFGTITVETAGQQTNFIFKFAKDPRKAGEAILAAREDFASKVTMSAAAPPPPPPPQPPQSPPPAEPAQNPAA